MKGKPTWKPMGLSAKKWNESGHAPGAANTAPVPLPPKRWLKRKKAEAQWPMEQKQEAGKAAE